MPKKAPVTVPTPDLSSQGTGTTAAKRAVWDAGFVAAIDGTFDNPIYPDLVDRMLWRQAWMAGNKCKLILKPKMSEHDHQVMLCHWAQAASLVRPELQWLYAVPNGGLRHVVVAAKLRAEGAKSGVPDLCLPVSRGGHGALYIEMKKPKGKTSESQKQWLQALTELGNLAVLRYDWQAARETITNYLDTK